MMNILEHIGDIFQWDSGLSLTVNGQLIDEAGTQYVHYQHKGKSAVYSVAVTDGVAAIPNELLQVPGAFNAYAYVLDESNGKTLVCREFHVVPRPMPPEYIYDPTPVITYPELVQLVEDLTVLKIKLTMIDAMAETLPAGKLATATVDDSGDGLIFIFGIPGGEPGTPGRGIRSIVKEGSEGLVDHYVINYTDDTVSDFLVTNGADGEDGNGIVSIIKTATAGLVDTYTITFTNGTTTTFNVTNGEDGEDAVIDPTLTHEGEAADAKATGDAIADVTQSDNGNTNNSVYTLRQTAASNFCSREKLQKIIGGSVVVNQLVDASTTSVTIPSGRKYVSVINGTWNVGASDGTAISVTGGQDMVIDLTKMLGTAIADYAYTLETATAGSGIAWLRSFGYLTEQYIPYNAGTLAHVSGLTSHDTIGFNQWDEEWVVGTISNRGVYSPTGNRVVSKNYIPIFPNTTYYKSPNIAWIFYYTNESTSSFISTVSPTGSTFTTPVNARYMRFYTASAYGTTYKDDICLNLSWNASRNGEYEPYVKHSYPLDSTLVLRGIPALTSAHEIEYNGDEYLPDGTVTRRFGYRAYQSGDESLANAITDGTNTVYLLSTPTAEQAEPYQETQVCDESGTEEFVGASIPVGTQTFYPIDLKETVEALAEIPQPPTTAGTYTLRAVVTASGVTYRWA